MINANALYFSECILALQHDRWSVYQTQWTQQSLSHSAHILLGCLRQSPTVGTVGSRRFATRWRDSDLAFYTFYAFYALGVYFP
jgi:hypothetical protein